MIELGFFAGSLVILPWTIPGVGHELNSIAKIAVKRTEKQSPDKHERRGIIRARVHELGQTTRDVFGRLATAVNRMDADRSEEG